MLRKLRVFVLRLLVAVCLVVAVFVLTQDLHVFPAAMLGLIEGGQPANHKLPDGVESFFVQTEDGESIEVWRVVAQKQLEPKKVAIVLHGNGQSMRGFLAMQLWFKQLGITSYSFDYRGFGRSSGWPSERGIYLDAEATWNLMLKKESLDPADVVVMGFSIGSGAAAYLASRFKPGVLLLLAAYSSIPDVVEQRPVLRYLKPFLWYDFPVAEYLKDLDSTCLVAVHGKRDRIIHFSHLAKLSAAYKGSASFKQIVVEDAGHNDLFGRSKERLGAALLDCFKPEASLSPAKHS